MKATAPSLFTAPSLVTGLMRQRPPSPGRYRLAFIAALEGWHNAICMDQVGPVKEAVNANEE